MSLLPDYSRQARTYDLTRAASPSVLAALRSALAGAPGPRLADIGGGTGNYAVALREVGWDPVVIDRSPEMLAHATRKGSSSAALGLYSAPFAAVAQLARASACHAEGREFESLQPLGVKALQIGGFSVFSFLGSA